MNLRNIVTLVATLGVLLVLLAFITPESIFEGILLIPFGFFILSATIFAFDIFLRAVRWYVLLKTQRVGDVKFLSLLAPMYSSSFINLVTPARAGEAVRLYVLKKNNNVSYSAGLSVILVEQILNLFSLLIVGLGSLLVIIVSGLAIISNGGHLNDFQKLATDFLPLITLIYFIGTILLLILIFFDARKFITILKILPLPERILKKGEKFLTTFAEGVLNLRKKPINLIIVLAISSLIWILEGIIIWLFSLVLIHQNFEFQVSLFASVMGNFAFVLPLLPGALGVYEVLVGGVFFLSEFYQNQDAFLVALMDRGVKTITLLIIGGYSTIILQAKDLKRREIMKEAKTKEKKVPRIEIEPFLK